MVTAPTSQKLPGTTQGSPLCLCHPPIPPGPLCRGVGPCPGVPSSGLGLSQHRHVMGFFRESIDFPFLRWKGAIQGARGRLDPKEITVFTNSIPKKPQPAPSKGVQAISRVIKEVHISQVNSSRVLGGNPINPTLQNLRKEGKIAGIHP